MDQQRDLNIHTQDGGNAVINLNPERVEVLLERSVLGRDTQPCPFAIGLRRERLREHWEARVQAVLRQRSRRERYAVLVATVCGWISFSLVAVLFVNPPPTASWLYALWALALAILCAGALREVRRLKATFPTPRMPPELDCDVSQK